MYQFQLVNYQTLNFFLTKTLIFFLKRVYFIPLERNNLYRLRIFHVEAPRTRPSFQSIKLYTLHEPYIRTRRSETSQIIYSASQL